MNRKISHGRAVLGRHVPDRRAVGDRQRCCAFTIKFDELADDFLRAQQLRNVQHEIGRSYTFAQLTAHVNAHHFRRQKVNRLSEHTGFRFYSAHAPANHAQTIDHCCVRISADQRVGVIK